jgi:hypothetical protein
MGFAVLNPSYAAQIDRQIVKLSGKSCRLVAALWGRKAGDRLLRISRTPQHYYERTVVLAETTAMFARKRTERRKSGRRTLGSRAWIRLDSSFAVRPCRVMDLSPTGARLSIEGEIPKSFALLLSLSSAGRKARIKWRRGNLVGIQFL